MRFLIAAFVLFSLSSIVSTRPEDDADANGLTDVNTSHSIDDTDENGLTNVDSSDSMDDTEENAPMGFDSSHPKDYMDENGKFNVSKWWAVCRFIECKRFEGDEMAKCINSKQPLVKMRKPPRIFLSGALLPDYATSTSTAIPAPGTGTSTSSALPPAAGGQSSNITSGPSSAHDDPLVGGQTPTTNATSSLPASFDIRERWPDCKDTANTVLDQTCNNCWAYSSSGVMSDRMCIASAGRVRAKLSPDDLTTCCSNCEAVTNNCDTGGYPSKAFEYWISAGVVGSKCKPPQTYANATNTQCVQACDNNKDYESVLHYGLSYWTMNNMTSMQKEIYANGSVEVLFQLHTDLYGYAGGIYIPTTNSTAGYHSVRLIGWGEMSVENVTLPYWTAVNSWGYGWGENGTFRVIRGCNAMNIETWATAGEPKIDDALLNRYT